MQRSSNTPATILTNESNIIFPLDESGRQYNSRLYTVVLTDGRATNQEIDKVLVDIMTAGSDPSNKKGWSRASCYFLVLYIVLTILQMFFFIFICVKLARDTYHSGVQFLISFGTMMVLLLGCMFSCVSGSCLCQDRTIPDMEIIRQKCQDVVDEHNKDYVLKGLRWHLPQEFPQWVELWKDYKLDAFGGQNRDVNLAENHGEREDVDLEKGSGKESAEDELELGNGNHRSKAWKDNKMYSALN